MTRISCLLLAALAGCAGTPPAIGKPIIGAAPTLSWTAAFAAGTQHGPIIFQSLGQMATLAMTDPNVIPSYQVTTQQCVMVSPQSLRGPSGTVTVTATSSGACVVTVDANGAIATINASVP